MNVFEFLAMAILVLSISAVVIVDRALSARRHTREQQALLTEQHIDQLVARINELERHNDELRQQLEWHRRLLEAQDTVIKHLPAPDGAPVASGAPR